MAFAVHALGICLVVTALRFIPRHFTGAHPRDPACRAPHACAYSRAVTAVDRAANEGPYDRSREGAPDRRVFLRARRGLPADRIKGVPAARAVVISELIEALGRAGKSHRAGARGHGGTARENDGERHDGDACGFHQGLTKPVRC
jgi:hypothetical protein